MAREQTEEELKEKELQEQELSGLIEKVAREVVRLGMAAPAVMMLELNKPLTFIASQSLLVAIPVLGAFVEPAKLGRLSEAMKNTANVDRLIDRIEELADEEEEKTRQAKAARGQTPG